jgi:hypothetical protein
MVVKMKQFLRFVFLVFSLLIISTYFDLIYAIKFSYGLKIPQYSEKQIMDFEDVVLSQYNLSFPYILRQIYLHKFDLLKINFMPEIEERIHCFAYLSEKEKLLKNMARSISIELMLKNNQITPPSQTAVPFGLDPFGNIFYADQIDGKDVIWFYDHEQDDPNISCKRFELIT